ncbi:MAG: CDP-archaeol synthase [Undibacterium umbellatum]|uniref:CDP-archaeol synthase n=1 Tax=Undibacterium umbellatum TaxID=2762300 RepID=UPI003BB5D92A
MNEVALWTQVIAPVLLGGVSNMVFVKSKWLDSWKHPMDAGRLARDGRRLFGANKTWKGFWGMVIGTACWSILIFLLLNLAGAISLEGLFKAALIGALLGLAYVLAELPNSYVKRRLDIAPGQNSRGWKGRLFIVIDQIDSVLGCLLLAMLLMPLQWIDAVKIVIICGGLHLMVNWLLFQLKLKNQKF